jgi:hypothetical protein
VLSSLRHLLVDGFLGIVGLVALRRKSFAVLLVLVAGCGGSARKQPVALAVASCLNDEGFLVEGARRTVEGTSPSGVGFTITFPSGKRATVDSSGNPSAARLSRAELAAIKTCVDKAVH